MREKEFMELLSQARDGEEFMELIKQEIERWKAEVRIKHSLQKKLREMLGERDKPQGESDEKVREVDGVKLVKSKPPRCKNCFFINEGIEDERRYMIFMETKINPLVVLFTPKEKLQEVLLPEDIYDSPRKYVVIVCPTFECGTVVCRLDSDVENPTK